MMPDAAAINIFAQRNKVTMLLLFGSRASANYREESDVDLGVLLTDKQNGYQSVMRGLMELFPGCQLDVTFLNKSDPLLNFQIISNYQLLYCSDVETFLNFYTTTVKKYHDMQKIYNLNEEYLNNFTGGKRNGRIPCPPHPPQVN